MKELMPEPGNAVEVDSAVEFTLQDVSPESAPNKIPSHVIEGLPEPNIIRLGKNITRYGGFTIPKPNSK